MAIRTDKITTMGIISDEVYADRNQNYFKDNPDDIEANNHTYQVLEHTPPENKGFNALLLQDKDTKEYVIAFRGTAGTADILDDAVVGLKNYSFEFQSAKKFVQDAMEKHHIPKENLTLAGHS